VKAHTLFTDRWGGVSEGAYQNFNLAFHVGDDPKAVAINRQILQQRHRTPPIVWMEQVHGDTIRQIQNADLDTLPACDALVTDQPDIALAVMVADCLPILMADETNGIIAAVHAGRNGTFLRIAPKTLRRMSELGANTGQIRVRIGPAIGPCCYEVDEKMVRIVKENFGDRYVNGRYLDLKALNRDQLITAGIKPEHIEISPLCTRCHKDLFSYRREQKTGRFAGLVWLEG